MFRIERLRKMCEKTLTKELSIANAPYLLLGADANNAMVIHIFVPVSI
jgi:hypothetical protein